MATSNRIEGIGGGGRGPIGGGRTSIRVSENVTVKPKGNKPFVNEKTTRGADQAKNQNLKKANVTPKAGVKVNARALKATEKSLTSKSAVGARVAAAERAAKTPPANRSAAQKLSQRRNPVTGRVVLK